MVVFYLSVNWFLSAKSYITSAFDFHNRVLLEKYLSSTMYNIRFFYEASKSLKTKYKVKCSNNVLIIDTGSFCKPIFKKLNYSGGYIENGPEIGVYSNKTGGYYMGTTVGYKIARLCYEGRDSYAILSDMCKVVECSGCKIRIIKKGDKIIIKWSTQHNYLTYFI